MKRRRSMNLISIRLAQKTDGRRPPKTSYNSKLKRRKERVLRILLPHYSLFLFLSRRFRICKTNASDYVATPLFYFSDKDITVSALFSLFSHRQSFAGISPHHRARGVVPTATPPRGLRACLAVDGKRGAIRERIIADASDTVGDLHRGKRGAIHERT